MIVPLALPHATLSPPVLSGWRVILPNGRAFVAHTRMPWIARLSLRLRGMRVERV